MFTRIEIRTHKRKLAFSLHGKISPRHALETAISTIEENLTDEEKKHFTISIRHYGNEGTAEKHGTR
jgi:hypothetical protein